MCLTDDEIDAREETCEILTQFAKGKIGRWRFAELLDEVSTDNDTHGKVICRLCFFYEGYGGNAHTEADLQLLARTVDFLRSGCEYRIKEGSHFLGCVYGYCHLLSLLWIVKRNDFDSNRMNALSRPSSCYWPFTEEQYKKFQRNSDTADNNSGENRDGHP